MRVALTIAGSDSGGGAGIQADLKTFARFGVFGTSAVTAVTAQNTLGVRAWEAVSAGMVRDQIAAVAEDLMPAAFKTGMLGSADVARAVAAAIRDNRLVNYVLDPVMIATSGDHLLEDSAVQVLRRDLVPLAALITPNSHEAAALTRQPVETVADAARAAQVLVSDFGASAALVTGGHLMDRDRVTDVLFIDEPVFFHRPRISSRNTHGTGCTLSAAITAGLALGESLEDSVAAAISYVRSAISAAPSLGNGSGPLGHQAAPAPVFPSDRNSVTSD